MLPTAANAAPYTMYTLGFSTNTRIFIIIPNYIKLNFNLAEMDKC